MPSKLIIKWVKKPSRGRSKRTAFMLHQRSNKRHIWKSFSLTGDKEQHTFGRVGTSSQTRKPSAASTDVQTRLTALQCSPPTPPPTPTPGVLTQQPEGRRAGSAPMSTIMHEIYFFNSLIAFFLRLLWILWALGVIKPFHLPRSILPSVLSSPLFSV